MHDNLAYSSATQLIRVLTANIHVRQVVISVFAGLVVEVSGYQQEEDAL